MKVNILDKYILKQMLGPFCFGVAAFSTIFIASSFLFRVAQYLTEYGAQPMSLIKLFFCLLPEVINYTFPMSMLLSSLLAFGNLSGNSEITAMRSGGISFGRIAVPVICIGFCVSMFSVIWAEKVVPPAKAEYENIVSYEIKNDVKPKTTEHIIIKNVRGDNLERLTYAKSFDEKKGIMEDITIEDFENGEIARIQKTPRAKWENGTWIMDAGTITDLTGKDGATRSMTFSKQVLPIDTAPKEVGLQQKSRDQMTIGELKQYIEILKQEKMPIDKYVMEMYARFTIPLSSLFFAMIGAPLGVQSQRTGSSMGLGISVIIIFIYYSIMTFMTGLGNGGAIPPLVAAVTPNLICMIIGLWLLYKKDHL